MPPNPPVDASAPRDFAMPVDLAMTPLPDRGELDGAGCLAGQKGCYTVYAHSDHVLYKLDLANKGLLRVGPFNAPMVNGAMGMHEDVITDLAVSPADVIYAISTTKLYIADEKDGHVTLLGSVKNCGVINVALTFDADGNLYAADYQGAFCKIDLKANPPMVTPIVLSSWPSCRR